MVREKSIKRIVKFSGQEILARKSEIHYAEETLREQNGKTSTLPDRYRIFFCQQKIEISLKKTMRKMKMEKDQNF